MGASCFATEGFTRNSEGADSVDVPVMLTQEATAYDFEVTEVLNATAAANSNDMTVDSLTVTNLSLTGQINYDLDITAESPYTMDAFGADYANMAVDAKVIGIQADGSVDMSTGTYTNAGTALTANGGTNTNEFVGKISTASAAITEAVKIATATPTVSWVSAA